MSERTRVIVGLLVLFASAPLFLVVVVNLRGATVVAAGVVALAVLGYGIYLSRTWLGIGRRPGGAREQQMGCLPMLVTLIALVYVGIIVWFVVFYGAAAKMSGADL